MPIYEYRCEGCDTRFEKLVRASGAAGLSCPSCGATKVTQQLSTFAAHTASSRPARDNAAMCPSGGVCPTPGACGLN